MIRITYKNKEIIELESSGNSKKDIKNIEELLKGKSCNQIDIEKKIDFVKNFQTITLIKEMTLPLNNIHIIKDGKDLLISYTNTRETITDSFKNIDLITEYFMGVDNKITDILTKPKKSKIPSCDRCGRSACFNKNKKDNGEIYYTCDSCGNNFGEIRFNNFNIFLDRKIWEQRSIVTREFVQKMCCNNGHSLSLIEYYKKKSNYVSFDNYGFIIDFYKCSRCFGITILLSYNKHYTNFFKNKDISDKRNCMNLKHNKGFRSKIEENYYMHHPTDRVYRGDSNMIFISANHGEVIEK